jgi:oligopeptide transport system ATP-binding protein
LVALVGESGCGKSTTARLILRLIEATSGKVEFNGQDVFSLSANALQNMRRDIQMIFQDPYSSLNPRWKIKHVLQEPLDTHEIGTNEERRKKVENFLDIVGLPKESGNKYAHEFSGGQRQRIGIARALITNPKFIICDEPLSALDVSIQAQIINLLKELQTHFDLTYLFITHDLRVVRFLCDQMAVMYFGKIVEMGPTERIFLDPKHPYTRMLFSAIPYPDPEIKKEEIIPEGDIPSPITPPSGCRFHPRCEYATAICNQREPELKKISENSWCACLLEDA